MEEFHTEDLRNVREGDTIDVETSEDDAFRMTCLSYNTHNSSDPNAVQEERTWTFDQEGTEVIIQVTDGLRRFEWEAEYPRHMPMYDSTNDVSLGYIVDLRPIGEIEA